MRELPFPDAYARLLPPVRARCRRLLRSTVLTEDVVQETFVRLWRAGPALLQAETATVMRWLFSTCTRLSIDVLRADRRTRSAAIDDGPDDPAAALPYGSAPDETVAARRCLEALHAGVPAIELEAVLLGRVDGLSQHDVATILGVSERTVRRMVERFDQRTAALREESLPARRVGRERKLRGRGVPVALVGIALAVTALFAGRSCTASPAQGEEHTQPRVSPEGDR